MELDPTARRFGPKFRRKECQFSWVAHRFVTPDVTDSSLQRLAS
jgi:hypothetical protein